MKRKRKDTVTTNLSLPRELRYLLDEIALARARRDGRKPHMNELVVEGIRALPEVRT